MESNRVKSNNINEYKYNQYYMNENNIYMHFPLVKTRIFYNTTKLLK